MMFLLPLMQKSFVFDDRFSLLIQKHSQTCAEPAGNKSIMYTCFFVDDHRVLTHHRRFSIYCFKSFSLAIMLLPQYSCICFSIMINYLYFIIDNGSHCPPICLSLFQKQPGIRKKPPTAASKALRSAGHHADIRLAHH